MNRLTRPLIAIMLALVLLTVACSGSENQNVVPVNAPAPGVLYVSTAAGDIQVVEPAASESSIFLSASTTGQTVVDLAPAANSISVNALVYTSGPTSPASAAIVTGSGFESIEASSDALSCLDPHAAAAAAVAHEATPGGTNGVQFAAVALTGETVGADFDLVSVACPRWSVDRNMVATAVPTRAGDPSSIVTVVQSSDGERQEIGFTGCGTTPTSFSPDDQFLAVALTCYSASWENSGLYLLPVAELADLGDLTGLTKLGSGLFGATAWHPEGEWVAAVHADAIEKQNIAIDLSAQPIGLQVIERSTLQTVDLDLVDGATPFSIAWLQTNLDG